MKSASQKENDPKVVMFGEEITDTDRCRHHRHGHGSVWGTLILCAGILLLMNTLGVIPWSVWDMLKRLWPVIVIAAGIDILFDGTGIGGLFASLLGIWMFGTILGIVFLREAPQLIARLPANWIEYITNVSSMLPNL